MEFNKIIQGIEEAIFQLAWWILTLPYMVYLALFRAATLMRVVDLEFRKPKGDQFKNLISPIAFFILVFVMPLTLFEPFYHLKLLNDHHLHFSGKATFFSCALLTLLLPPTFFFLRFRKQKFTKDNLHKAFLKQCYLQGPLLLILLPSLYLSLAIEKKYHYENEILRAIIESLPCCPLIIYVTILARHVVPMSKDKSSDSSRKFLVVIIADLALIIIFLLFTKYLISNVLQ